MEYRPEDFDYKAAENFANNIVSKTEPAINGKKVFSTKNPEHFQIVMDSVIKVVLQQSKKQEDDETGKLQVVGHPERDVNFYLAGLKNQVPGPWSQIFMEEATRMKEEYDLSNDPDYQKYMELKKRFEK